MKKQKSEFGYQGITYDPKAKVDCDNGLHQLDEVWSVQEHYFSCDACGLIVHISSVDRAWVKDEPKKIERKVKLSKADKKGKKILGDLRKKYPIGFNYGLEK